MLVSKDPNPKDAAVLDIVRNTAASGPEYCDLPQGLAELLEVPRIVSTVYHEVQSRISTLAETLDLPSGWMVCDDPGSWRSEAPTFFQPVPPGKYQLRMVEAGHDLVAMVLLIQPEKQVVRYARAFRKFLEDGRENDSDRIGVDSGQIGFADAESLYGMSMYEREQMCLRAHEEGKNQEPGSRIQSMPMKNGLDAIVFSTDGDGGFPAYWGLDANDRPVRLVIEASHTALPVHEDLAFRIGGDGRLELAHGTLTRIRMDVLISWAGDGSIKDVVVVTGRGCDLEYAVTDQSGATMAPFQPVTTVDDESEYELAGMPESGPATAIIGGHVHVRMMRGYEYHLVTSVPEIAANSAKAFSNAWTACGCGYGARWWHRRLKKAYSDPVRDGRDYPARYYHNWRHLTACLIELDAARPHHQHLDLPAIEMALWFHDLVYDSKAGNNEEESARAAAHALKEGGAPAALIEKVCALILATKTHPTDADPGTALLVDIDLSIFGQPADVFDEYQWAIRQEYGWVPQAVYEVKRREVLARFLARETIYQTPFFRERYEAVARENLRSAVEQRSQGG